MNIIKSWDEQERESAMRVAGLFATALTVFIFISIISYLFHWQEDMSILTDPAARQAGNNAGSLGFRTGRLLVCDLFGLGSLSLLIILAAVSLRLLARRWSSSLVKTALIAVFGAFFASLLLAFTGDIAGLGNCFGGGLGGRCGAEIVARANALLGNIVTGAVILAFIAAFLVLSSRRFSRWFASIGRRKPKEKTDTQEDISAAGEVSIAQDTESPAQTLPDGIGTLTDETAGLAETVYSDDFETVDIYDHDLPAAAEEAPDTNPEEPEGGFTIERDDTLDKEPVKELKPIDNRLDPPEGLPKYRFPSFDLLKDHSSGRREVSSEELTRNNNKIRAALANYKIELTDVRAVVGPTVTLYKVYPAPGVKISDIRKLQEDIALSLNAKGVRVVTLSDSVGIEVANDYSSIVTLKSLMNSEAFRRSKAELPVAIGYTITQEVKVFDIADAPHLLIAGATKQGKSVGLNVIVSSLLYSKHPSELRFVFIDPKMVEFSAYKNLLKHYLAVLPEAGDEQDELDNAIIKTPKKAEKILRSLCTEMDDRYLLLSKAEVNNIKLYNAKYKERRLNPSAGHRFLPYLVVVVDEYADLTMMTGASPETRAASRSITNSIIRLAQKGRAAGLHVILATQRPSVDVISGIIKSNFPMRIAFRVASRTDSQTILDQQGAEKLIGKGDMLFSAGIETERIQCGYVDGDEIDAITSFISGQQGYGKSYNTPYYLPEVNEQGQEDNDGAGGGSNSEIGKLDARFREAAEMVVRTQRGSTSDIQRKLGMGYAKAGRIMDQLEAAGIVGPQDGSKLRQVLVGDMDTLEKIIDSLTDRS